MEISFNIQSFLIVACSAPYTFIYDACNTVPCGDKCSADGGCLVSESFRLSGLSGTLYFEVGANPKNQRLAAVHC